MKVALLALDEAGHVTRPEIIAINLRDTGDYAIWREFEHDLFKAGPSPTP